MKPVIGGRWGRVRVNPSAAGNEGLFGLAMPASMTVARPPDVGIELNLAGRATEGPEFIRCDVIAVRIGTEIHRRFIHVCLLRRLLVRYMSQ